MRISDRSSDVCSSDLDVDEGAVHRSRHVVEIDLRLNVAAARPCARFEAPVDDPRREHVDHALLVEDHRILVEMPRPDGRQRHQRRQAGLGERRACGLRLVGRRSEEHTSELQSLMRISYAVFCLKEKKPHLDGRLLLQENNTQYYTHTTYS